MPHTFFSPSNQRVVEPKKRMAGGRYGWVVHRFPIKGGRTLAETVMRDWSQAIEAQCARPSYFSRFIGEKK